MRCLLWSLVLVCGLANLAVAGEAVDLSGRVTGVYQYPRTQTICMPFETKDQKRFLICDDVTAKDVIEQLFDYGKRDTDCRIAGTVAKKAGDDVYLQVTGVSAAK